MAEQTSEEKAKEAGKLAEEAKKEFSMKVAKFQEGFKKLQEEFQLEMYAADMVMQNGEVIPVIRIKEIKNEDTTKQADIVGAEA